MISNGSNIQSSALAPKVLSKHNIIVPITDSDEFFIVNPLHKSADIINTDELKKLHAKLDLLGG